MKKEIDRERLLRWAVRVVSDATRTLSSLKIYWQTKPLTARLDSLSSLLVCVEINVIDVIMTNVSFHLRRDVLIWFHYINVNSESFLRVLQSVMSTSMCSLRLPENHKWSNIAATYATSLLFFSMHGKSVVSSVKNLIWWVNLFPPSRKFRSSIGGAEVFESVGSRFVVECRSWWRYPRERETPDIDCDWLKRLELEREPLSSFAEEWRLLHTIWKMKKAIWNPTWRKLPQNVRRTMIRMEIVLVTVPMIWPPNASFVAAHRVRYIVQNAVKYWSQENAGLAASFLNNNKSSVRDFHFNSWILF